MPRHSNLHQSTEFKSAKYEANPRFLLEPFRLNSMACILANELNPVFTSTEFKNSHI
jgi:hypothetical protein